MLFCAPCIQLYGLYYEVTEAISLSKLVDVAPVVQQLQSLFDIQGGGRKPLGFVKTAYPIIFTQMSRGFPAIECYENVYTD